jgi:hypothetical protein
VPLNDQLLLREAGDQIPIAGGEREEQASGMRRRRLVDRRRHFGTARPRESRDIWSHATDLEGPARRLELDEDILADGEVIDHGDRGVERKHEAQARASDRAQAPLAGPCLDFPDARHVRWGSMAGTARSSSRLRGQKDRPYGPSEQPPQIKEPLQFVISLVHRSRSRKTAGITDPSTFLHAQESRSSLALTLHGLQLLG